MALKNNPIGLSRPDHRETFAHHLHHPRGDEADGEQDP
jgi:hypothetical protein